MGTILNRNISHNRRDFLKTAGATALATNLFTGRVKGANDRVAIAFIGMGAMGRAILGYAMKVPGFQPVAVCDVYQPHLERAVAAAKKGGFQAKAVKDFREIIADKSIDAVCISTPTTGTRTWRLRPARRARTCTSRSRRACTSRKARRWSRPRESTSGWCRREPCSGRAATSRRPRKSSRTGSWAR